MEFIKKNPRIYILSGKARTGKNKIANIIKETYDKKGLKTINISFASYLKEYAKNILGWDGNEDTKPREFLQQLGIELIKERINNHMLIDRIIDDIKVYSYFYDIITISDARLESEIISIKENFNKLVTIHVYKNIDNDLTNKQKQHLTETALDDYQDYDYEICNDGSLDELVINIERIIDEVETK
jgi:hypothetical protein